LFTKLILKFNKFI